MAISKNPMVCLSCKGVTHPIAIITRLNNTIQILSINMKIQERGVPLTYLRFKNCLQKSKQSASASKDAITISSIMNGVFAVRFL